MFRFHVGFFAALFALSMIGCGGAAESSETTSAEQSQATSGDEGMSHDGADASSAQLVPPGEATIGDTTTCPVSGETFTVTEDSPHAEYEGRTYYFCCPGCSSRFEANPEQFLHSDAS